MEKDSADRRRLAADVFAGGGIGLLLGTVLGLSTTPVVALVVGALSSILAVFLGLDGKAESRLPSANAIRIGAFGFATVLGLALGLHMRINNPLAAAPSRALERWTQAFPDNPTLARQMMIFERTAILPASLNFHGGEVEAEAVTLEASMAPGRQSTLFSTLSDYDACTRLNPSRYATAGDAIAAYGRAGAPDAVRAVAAELGRLAEAERETGLRVAHAAFCEMQMEDTR